MIGALHKQGYIYIMSNQYRTTFYIGVTSDLGTRVWQHTNNEGSDFVKKHRLYDLIYYEHFERILMPSPVKSNLKIGIETGRSI
jgi:putative endonuclease